MTNKIRIVVDSATNVMGAFDKLLEEHWNESAKNKQLMVLAPDYDKYLALEQHGALLTIIAYDEWDDIVGYSVNLIGSHLHYKELKVCTNDVLFLGKDYREGSLGLRLMAETERVAKERGYQIMLWHAKEDSALDKIMQRKKYQVQDVIYSKTL